MDPKSAVGGPKQISRTEIVIVIVIVTMHYASWSMGVLSGGGGCLINKLLSHKGDLSLSIPSTFICTICSHSHFYLQLFVWSFLSTSHKHLPFSILTSMLGSFIV